MAKIKALNFHEMYDVKWFEKLIVYIKSKYDIISLDDFNLHFKNNNKLSGSYLLTVDDAHFSFYKYIYPIIRKHEVPIAVFVSPKISKEKINFWWQEIENYDSILLQKTISDIIKIPINIVDRISLLAIFKSLKIEEVNEIITTYQRNNNISKKSFQNMSIDQLREVEKSNLVTIGAHTMNHPVLLNEDDATSKYEIQESVYELANILNHDIKYFAYPNGIPNVDFSHREMEYVKASGVDISFSTEFKKVDNKDNLMKIPRGEITNGHFNIRTKLFLWKYWNILINIKNGNAELVQRKYLSSILARNSNNYAM